MAKSNEVVIEVSALERMHEGINAAYWKSVSEDMVQSYKTLDIDGTRSKSALTGMLEDALTASKAAMELSKDNESKEEAQISSDDSGSSGT